MDPSSSLPVCQICAHNRRRMMRCDDCGFFFCDDLDSVTCHEKSHIMSHLHRTNHTQVSALNHEYKTVKLECNNCGERNIFYMKSFYTNKKRPDPIILCNFHNFRVCKIQNFNAKACQNIFYKKKFNEKIYTIQPENTRLWFAQNRTSVPEDTDAMKERPPMPPKKWMKELKDKSQYNNTKKRLDTTISNIDSVEKSLEEKGPKLRMPEDTVAKKNRRTKRSQKYMKEIKDRNVLDNIEERLKATINNIGDKPPKKEGAKLRFKTIDEYQKHFCELITAEKKYEVEDAESRRQVITEPSLEQNEDETYRLTGTLLTKDPRLCEGNPMDLRSAEINIRATIVSVTQSEESTVLELSCQKNVGEKLVEKLKEKIFIQPSVNTSAYSRQSTALNQALQKLNKNLKFRILGEDLTDQTFPGVKEMLPRDLNVPGLPNLNDCQLEIVTNVLQRPLSLIQGPPGTGKTGTSAVIVYHMVKLSGQKALVCGPSNVSVDGMAERVAKTGLKVIRLYSSGLLDERGDEILKNPLSLQSQLAKNEEYMSASKVEKEKIAKSMLESCDVVCCTCFASADHTLSSIVFSHVLIDEATQASEPLVMIPLMKGARQVVLVGDHRQLPPIVNSSVAIYKGLGRSLFERLIELGHLPHRLLIQYRMHPSLSFFPNNTFYEGALQNGVTAEERVLAKSFWRNEDHPTMFWHCPDGVEETEGTSFFNKHEANAVIDVLKRLDNLGVKSVGVITPYDAQTKLLLKCMRNVNGPLCDAEVNTVDAYQGREKDIIVMTCVRSNSKNIIGFLADPRRLNVAITRARHGLVIIGNAQVLSQNPLWASLVLRYMNLGLMNNDDVTFDVKYQQPFRNNVHRAGQQSGLIRSSSRKMKKKSTPSVSTNNSTPLAPVSSLPETKTKKNKKKSSKTKATSTDANKREENHMDPKYASSVARAYSHWLAEDSDDSANVTMQDRVVQSPTTVQVQKREPAGRSEFYSLKPVITSDRAVIRENRTPTLPVGVPTGPFQTRIGSLNSEEPKNESGRWCSIM